MNKKHYKLEFTVSEDGTVIGVESANSGFTAFEIMGMLEMKMLDVARQMWGEIKPKAVKRTYVEKEEQP